MIRFEQDVCADLERSKNLEWLETNGLGGFSSSTVTGLNTRRYHGLLTAATKPPVGRYVLLSKMEETLLIGGRHFDLSANQYAGVVYPQGHRFLQEFRLDPFPTFVYRAEAVEVEKRVILVHGQNTVIVEYQVRVPGGSPSCVLELRPLIAFRDYHSTTHQNDAIRRAVEIRPGAVSVAPYPGLPALHFGHNADAVEETGNWYFNFEYDRERERGLDQFEDLFNPFLLRYSLPAGGTATVLASTQPCLAADAPFLRRCEVERRQAIVALSPAQDPLIRKLTAAADQFIVRRGDLNTVIAGYHWFADWGRDTMISLPGLTLATGRPEIARNILEAFASAADQGMLPNRFLDAGEQPEYNTVDATFWLFEAVRSYRQYTGDDAFIREKLYAKLNEIVDWHISGTRYGIRVDSDGLLACGEPGMQLTWMDAKIGDWVVTPRSGKPVEIQALWYNALCVLAEFAERFGDTARQAFLSELAGRVKASFAEQFWNHDGDYLYDVVNGQDRDGSIRPNQIFAVSLHHRMLSPEQEVQVVETVEQELLTPLGLRSLSPHDPNYRPRCEGGINERDSAYHQGTVWPWLMGPFLSAYLKTHHHSPAARAQAKTWLEPFSEHLLTEGLGQVSEITDAEPPFTPRGCIAQAWSVSELLRAAVEDVYQLPIAKHSQSVVAAG